jgi:phage terminase large subunit-like protein
MNTPGVCSTARFKTRLYAYIRAAGQGADWTDPVTWAAANPSLGVTVTLEELSEQCQAAQHSPGLENAFRRYRVNEWTQQLERFVPLSVWDACEGHAIRPEEYRGRKFYGGLDLGNVADLSAMALLFECPREPGAVDVLIRAWLPEDAIRESRQSGLYRQWQRDGLLSATPGNTTDYGFIHRQVLEDATAFGCHSIGIDRLFQGLGLSQQLADSGLQVFPCGMGFLSMSPLVAELERLILAGRLHHGCSPVLRSAVDAVEMVLDAAGNRKPSRADRSKKIDALVAVLFALDRWLRREAIAPPAEPQLYFLGGIQRHGRW